MTDIMFDVDGTLMDIEHRRHFVTQRPKDFKSFREHTQFDTRKEDIFAIADALQAQGHRCLLYTSPSPRDRLLSRMPSSA